MGDDYQIKWFQFWRSDKFRNVQWLIAAVALLAIVALINVHLVGNIILKLCEVSLFAYVGYWADRSLFPYARCGFGETDAAERASQLRRAIIIAAVILGGALAL